MKGDGSFVFTLYEEYIFAQKFDDTHKINLSFIKTVKKCGSAIIIEYETESCKLKR